MLRGSPRAAASTSLGLLPDRDLACSCCQQLLWWRSGAENYLLFGLDSCGFDAPVFRSGTLYSAATGTARLKAARD